MTPVDDSATRVRDIRSSRCGRGADKLHIDRRDGNTMATVSEQQVLEALKQIVDPDK